MKSFKARWLSFSAFAFDLCAVALAWMLAYVIRFNGPVPDPFWTSGQPFTFGLGSDLDEAGIRCVFGRSSS